MNIEGILTWLGSTSGLATLSLLSVALVFLAVCVVLYARRTRTRAKRESQVRADRVGIHAGDDVSIGGVDVDVREAERDTDQHRNAGKVIPPQSRVSIAFPRLLAKGRSSTFVFFLCPTYMTAEARAQIARERSARDMSERTSESAHEPGERVTVSVHCPVVDFKPESVTLRFEDRLNRVVFLGIPRERLIPLSPLAPDVVVRLDRPAMFA
jgi:hypothetical protein